jgi:F0F1-type ATP synthase beta subunit
MAVAEAVKVGKVVQIIGPVVDIEFAGGELPAIYNAVRITGKSGEDIVDVIVEVEQHLGENRVRTVAMKPTDGLQRGMDAADQGSPITMPVGPQTLGRVMNVLGEPVGGRFTGSVSPSVHDKSGTVLESICGSVMKRAVSRSPAVRTTAAAATTNATPALTSAYCTRARECSG